MVVKREEERQTNFELIGKEVKNRSGDSLRR